jgi:hypothetical protein
MTLLGRFGSLQGQLCYEPCTKLPCGAACFRCSRSFHQCKKTFWRCCCRIPCIIVFVIFIIALSLIASGTQPAATYPTAAMHPTTAMQPAATQPTAAAMLRPCPAR